LFSYWIWVYWLNIFAWGFRALVVNEYASGKYDFPSQVEGYTEGELVLKQLGFMDANGDPFTFEWTWYSLLFSLLISVVSIIVASICLYHIRFATGKSLANASIEKKEDVNDEIKSVEAALPFQNVDLTFNDIHYTVISSIGNEKIELLQGIDGVVEAGKMTALVSTEKSPNWGFLATGRVHAYLLMCLQFEDGLVRCGKNYSDGCPFP
jgi:hypothetical protein